MLLEQDPQQLVRRDQPDEAVVGVDHGQAALVAVHHPAGSELLIGVRRDARRVVVHDLLEAITRAGGQQSLDRDQADEPPGLEHDHILGAAELAPRELLPQLSCALVAPGDGNAVGRILRRDAE